VSGQPEQSSHPGRTTHSTAVAGLIGCALLLFCFAQTAWHAWRGKSATFDEPPGLVAAWVAVHDRDFRMDPEDPPLFKYFVAAGTHGDDMPRDYSSPFWSALLSDPSALGDFARATLYQTPQTNADALLASARARMIFLGMLLGALIAWCSWRLAGPLAAIVALALFCFDPNFLAYAPLVKGDVPITLLFLALMMSIWLMGERATLLRMAATALLLGALVTTKYSGVLGIVILAVALLCRSLGPGPWRVLRWTARTRLARLAAGAAIGAASLLIVYVMIWASYGFRFAPTPDPALRFDMRKVLETCCEQQFGREYANRPHPDAVWLAWKAHWRPPLAVRVALWANQHELAPQACIEGFLFQYSLSFVRLTWLCGRAATVGWWYYFPLAMAFKTPLATLLGTCIAAVVWLWRRGGIFARHWWPLCCVLVVPVLYMAAAMASRLNLGLRHVLPVYPYLFIALGVAAALMWRYRPRITAAVTAILLAGLATETYSAYPDFIPFFNIACGGAPNGWRLLGDSNVDWGQELPALAQWVHQNPGYQLQLIYFGTADPRYYRIHYVPIAGGYAPPDMQPGDSNLPPVLAMSVTAWQNPFLPEKDLLKSLQTRKPLAVLGGSMYLFDRP
jgi:4-amino-4-deoxy-L-arabinose transferase-like glycosyltransferase